MDHNQINARALIGHSAMAYCASKPSRPQVSMVYRLINTCDVGTTLEEFVNHSPEARDLRILLVFYQHPARFISL